MRRHPRLRLGSVVVVLSGLQACTMNTSGLGSVFEEPDAELLDQTNPADTYQDSSVETIEPFGDASIDTGSVDSSVDALADVDAGKDSSQDPETDTVADTPQDAITEHPTDTKVDSAPDGAKDAPTDTEAGPAYPQSCSELPTGTGTTGIGLYLDNDPNKPFPAKCRYSTNGAATYLVLSANNVSSYPLGSCAKLGTGATLGVVTTWLFIRFDPATRRVNTGDFEGASSTGATFETNSDPGAQRTYTRIPFGSARTCEEKLPAAPQASINLTGTHFAIAATQLWKAEGYPPTGLKQQVSIDPTRQTAGISVGGYPGGITPCESDYYTTEGGACLLLDYVP